MIRHTTFFASRALAYVKRKIDKRQAARWASLNARPNKLGVLAIMKNEGMGIDEWIEHYLWMGASRIYLIDNGSTDDTLERARAWVTKGKVNLVEYPERHQQKRHYWSAIKHFRIKQECEWLLIADLDEFWFCPSGDTLVDALSEFDLYDVIYSNWVMFGSGGHVQQPDSIRQGFTLRRPGVAPHRVKKYICRTSILKRFSTIGIHQIYGADSSRTVSDTVRFQLNHYPIQSLDFFRSVKMTRGAVSNTNSEKIRDMNYFLRYDHGCEELDRKLADLLVDSEYYPRL